jgi:hypothetical protein
MAFVLPEFPLLCSIYQGPWATKSLRYADVPGNLAVGKRVGFWSQDWQEFGAAPLVDLLVPAGTDVRSRVLQAEADLIEIPQGSGRWYQVTGVEDIGKGFPNEHRMAQVAQVSQFVDNGLGHYIGLFWPVPMP